MLRTKLNFGTRKHARSRASVALVALAYLAALAAPSLVSTRAHAQQPANQNGQQPAPRTKRITPLKTSDAAQGSRVTITSDGELNDYSAYRSGDRFIVVIPQAQGGEGAGAKGRGFEGAQVTRRGNDLVYTFKLAPGASAHVNQRFNRLDVQFTAPSESTNAQATPQPTPRGAIETAGIKQTPTPAPQPTPNTRANPTSATGQTPIVSPTTGAVATNPNAATNPDAASPSLSLTPAPTPSASPSASASVAPSAPEQIAQAQPAQPAPVGVVAQQPAAPTSTLGAVVARNFPWIIAAMIAVGVVFLLVTRFGDRQSAEPLPPALAAPTALEPRAVRGESLAGLEPAKHADAAPSLPSPTTAALTTAAASSAATTAKAASTEPAKADSTEPARGKAKRGKRRKEERREARRAARGESSAPSVKTVAEVTGATAASRATTQPASATTSISSAATEASAKAKQDVPSTEASAHASAEKSGALKSAAEAALVAAPLVAGSVAAAAGKNAGEKEAASSTPAHADTERVGEEIRKLLAGEAYDESVVGASDAATREMVASELSAALSSRQPQRNERARAAFMRHGYFEEAARHLRSAEAPAQRASAAHSLSLVRDRAATPHVVAALEDPSPEVRRASVEALAALHDPAALEPLEALRWRETSRLVPRSLIMRAIEASTPSVEEIEPPRQHAPEKIEATATASRPAEADTTDATAQTASAVEAVAETPTIETPTIETSAVETQTVETPTIETSAVETSTVESSVVESPAVEPLIVDSPVVETSPAIETTTAETSAVETPSAEARAVEATSEHEVGVLAGSAGAVAVELSADTGAELAQAAETQPATQTKGAEKMADAPLLDGELRREDAGGASAVEPSAVYTFDESEAATRPTQRAGDEAARRGTGGLEASTLEEAEASGGEHAPAETHESHVYSAPEFAATEDAPTAEVDNDDWFDLTVEEQHVSEAGELSAGGAHEAAADHTFVFEPTAEADDAPTLSVKPIDATTAGPAAAHVEKGMEIVSGPVEKGLEIVSGPHASDEKGIEVAGSDAAPAIRAKSIELRLESEDVGERAASVRALARLSTGEAFQQICAAFDDPSVDVRNAAARSLYDVSEDRADTFTRALREASPERRRQIGASLSSSGLADEAISQLTGESRERTYDAFSLLFLMAKAGETAPLIRAIESHPETEVRLAVVKLLALSGQHEVLASFKRLAVRGSLPNEVRSAVMEAIYQISSAGAQPTRS